MKTTLWVAWVFTMISCNQDEDVVTTNYAPLTKADSAILQSQRLHDSTQVILYKADSVTQVVVGEVAKNVENLEKLNTLLSQENGKLKVGVRTQAIIVHDTILITEKKSFWGRTKTTKDTLEANLSSIIIDTTNHK